MLLSSSKFLIDLEFRIKMSSKVLSSLSLLFTIIITINQLASPSVAQLSCRDANGKPVDWFVAYKFPKMKNGPDLFKSGYAYSYISSGDVDGELEKKPSDMKSDVDTESQLFLYRFRDLLFRYIGYQAIKPRRSPRLSQTPKKSRSKSVGDNSTWSAQPHLLTDPSSIVMRTLSVAWHNYNDSLALGVEPSINSIFYNDDPPENPDARSEKKPNLRRAHAKGVLLMDEKTNSGLWLTHSVPRFPPRRDHQIEFYENSVKYGQTFMCVTFDLDKSGREIVDHLVNMRPLVYENVISESLMERIPDLDSLNHDDLMKHKRIPVVPKLAQLVTARGGLVLHLYSKSTSFNQDLYSGWIDHDIQSGLFVETWRQGTGPVLNSSCPSKDYHVNNVQELKYNQEITWPYTKDHSKWAISEDEDLGIVCIGDSNRMATQFKRGGGAVCFKCPICWSAFSNTILDVEPCPINSKKLNVEFSGNRTTKLSLVARLAHLLVSNRETETSTPGS